MRILHVTDSHGTVKSPEGRRDVYYITFLKKLYELGIVCKKLNIDMILHTGDLFHSARVSNKFAGQTIEMIRAMKVPFYVVPGNHDIEGYTINTLDQTTLGLLAKAGTITILDRDHPVTFNINDNGESYTLALSGQEYYANIDRGNPQDFEMQQDEADINILGYHGYLSNINQPPGIIYTPTDSIITDADIILSGHYHRQFEAIVGDVSIYNPGSMMRVEQTEYNKTHTPQYGILDIYINDARELVYQYKFHDFRVAQPSTVVFDYDSKYVEKQAMISLDNFKASIANTVSNMAPNTNIPSLILNVGTKSGVSRPLINFTIFKYQETLQSLPEMFEAPQGYIESPAPKIIRSVHIEGFQSHEDTFIEFDDKFNIITGESNNGKTSIIRAILWVIDNKPLGTDYITTGKDECKVRINYIDGTFIERGRTRKDTGYYTIKYIGDDGTFKESTYRGFANAIPVEVINVHQMPYVSITKDIETHLNVLSQLDMPFLLFESPPNKAAAIGRITGTHVIDATIKGLSNAIRTTNTAVTEHKTDLSNEQNALKALPNYDDHHYFTKLYEKIYNFLFQRDHVLKKMQANWAEQVHTKLKIDDKTKFLNEQRTILSLSSTIDAIYYRVSACTSLSDAYNNLISVNDEIQNNTDGINKNKSLTALAPIISSIASRIRNYIQLKQLYDSYESNKKQIKSIFTTAINSKDFHSVLSAIISFIKVRIHVGLDISYSCNTLAFTEKQIEEATKIKSSNDKQLQAVNKQINMVSQDMLHYVMGQNICPCCGQFIYGEECATNVIHYMTKQQE